MATTTISAREMEKRQAEAGLPHPQQIHESHAVLYGFLFVIGFAVRFVFMWYHKTYVVPRGEEVMSIAAHLARGQGFSSPFFQDTGPTTWVAPLYPWIVSFAYKWFGILTAKGNLAAMGLQCAIAAATGPAIYLLGKRTFSERIGFWAAWIWTLGPFFYRWGISWIWDFPASALLLVLALIVAVDVGGKGSRKAWLWLGGVWGLIALTNPALLSVMPFTVAHGAVASRRAERKWGGDAALAMALLGAMLAPWLIRNYVVFGHPVFLRGNYWFEFSVGNFHYSNGMGFLGKHPEGNPAELEKYAHLGEYEYFRQAKARALQFVREYPGEFANLTVHRAWWFWDGTPVNYAPGEWWEPWELWPLSIGGWLGLLFVLTRKPRGWILYAGCLIAYPLPYYLTFSAAKYRHAIEPELLLLSLYLVKVLWDEIRLLVTRPKELSPA